MRILGLILGILGGLAAGFLGMKWLGDANNLKTQIEVVRSAGVSMAELDKMITAAYLMLAGAILPAIWAPKSLVFTCILLLGGIVSFFAKPRQAAVTGA